MSETASAVEQSGQAALDSATPDARAEWFRTGSFPEAKPESPAADEGPSDDDEPEVADVAAPAKPAEPAKPVVAAPEKPISKRQQQINDLIRDRETARLETAKIKAELEALKTKPAEPAKPEPKTDTPAATTAKPDPSQFQTYDEYIEAFTDWKLEQRDAARKAADDKAATERAQQEQRTRFEQRVSGWVERRDAFAAKTAGWKDHAEPFLDRVQAGTPLGDVLIDSERGPELAWHLATHLDEADRIARLGPAQQLIELGKLEGQIIARTPASAVPAAKAVSTAPAPPIMLGSRAADPADEITDAVGRGDFRAYAAAKNREEIASRRSR